MGARKFEKMATHLIATHDTNAKKIATHFGNATCHSRTSDHWAPPYEVQEGRLANRGGEPKARRLGAGEVHSVADWWRSKPTGRMGYGEM